MFRYLSILVDRFPLGRFGCLAMVVVCLGVSGCSNLSMRGERFSDNELSDVAGELRQADATGSSDAFSNKARQIDRNLGGARPFSPENLLAP